MSKPWVFVDDGVVSITSVFFFVHWRLRRFQWLVSKVYIQVLHWLQGTLLCTVAVSSSISLHLVVLLSIFEDSATNVLVLSSLFSSSSRGLMVSSIVRFVLEPCSSLFPGPFYCWKASVDTVFNRAFWATTTKWAWGAESGRIQPFPVNVPSIALWKESTRSAWWVINIHPSANLKLKDVFLRRSKYHFYNALASRGFSSALADNNNNFSSFLGVIWRSVHKLISGTPAALGESACTGPNLFRFDMRMKEAWNFVWNTWKL